MKVLNVPGMHCEACVNRISTALMEDNIEFEVDLSQQTVSVKNDDIIISKTISVLEDLGFSAK